jgi:hypothetical protein
MYKLLLERAHPAEIVLVVIAVLGLVFSIHVFLKALSRIQILRDAKINGYLHDQAVASSQREFFKTLAHAITAVTGVGFCFMVTPEEPQSRFGLLMWCSLCAVLTTSSIVAYRGIKKHAHRYDASHPLKRRYDDHNKELV